MDEDEELIDENEGQFELNDDLIDEFLDYCEMAERPSASLKFNTKISHLIREDRKAVLAEFVRFLDIKQGIEDDEEKDDEFIL